jgi:hypothetical protein
LGLGRSAGSCTSTSFHRSLDRVGFAMPPVYTTRAQFC